MTEREIVCVGDTVEWDDGECYGVVVGFDEEGDYIVSTTATAIVYANKCRKRVPQGSN